MLKTRLFQLIVIVAAIIPISVWASGPVGGNNQMNINHNQRSDTIDVLHYFVDLTITSVASSPISGFTAVTCVPKLNGISTLNLDLLRLTVDSVVLGSNVLNYNYNDTLLKINLGGVYNIGDTFTVNVAYHGIPQTDPSGFGGFTFSSGYAYNLGVGFSADPHVYGRIWHPCFDNFVDIFFFIVKSFSILI
jgi:aminopeptidase N